MELIATCAFGLEKLVHDELKQLGLWTLKTEDGRITFRGDQDAIIKSNLWLRCAERVQIKMAEFKAVTFDQLFDAVNALEWEKFIDKDDAFPNTATAVKSILHSEPAIQSIVKKAMVKRLQQGHKTETLAENSGIIYQIFIKANKDQFVISINTSGDSLHKRGYRIMANLAPMKETLAAAIIKLSDWTPARPLVDTFCGSGTIAIEATMIANNIAPGLRRRFAFQKWPWMDQKLIVKAFEEARNAIKPVEKLPIYCFDIDPATLAIAEENARRAGFDKLNFKRADFNDLDFRKFENCTFIVNPPYGERLEEKADVAKMYRDFGNKFKETRHCSLFLITSDENFPALFGRPADKNRKLFNGNLRCYLYSYFAKGTIKM